MNYASIKPLDPANGFGIRVSLFVSGCRHYCPGCFNAEAWDFSFGQPFTEETEASIFKMLEPAYIKGLSLLGGEPFEPENQVVLTPFLERLKQTLPQKDIWCYTGSTLENLLSEKDGNLALTKRMFRCIDVLVDGPYMEKLHDIRLKFKGSSNQRILLLQPTLETGSPVLWSDTDWDSNNVKV